jgi:hypothetical protein
MFILIQRWTLLTCLLLPAGFVAAQDKTEKPTEEPLTAPRFYFGDAELINFARKPEDVTPVKSLTPGKRDKDELATARKEREEARKKRAEADQGAEPGVGKIAQRTAEGEKAVKELIKPWHHFKQEWWQEATVVLKGSYCSGLPHCELLPGGVRARWFPRGFMVSDVFKGQVVCPKFPANLTQVRDRPEYPRQFLLWRHYLLFLKPSKESLAVLSDPKVEFEVKFPSIWKGDFLAVIDLSETQEHAEASRVQATRSETHKGFTFSPAKWAAFRQARELTVKAARRFQEFLFEVVLTDGATLRDVRSYLGEPDYHSQDDHGIYYTYYLPRSHEGVRVGDHAGWLQISFSEDLELTTARLRYMKCIAVNETGRGWDELSGKERKQLGVGNENRSAGAK